MAHLWQECFCRELFSANRDRERIPGGLLRGTSKIIIPGTQHIRLFAAVSELPPGVPCK